ncbi:hypothetical protein KKG52_00335 [Patescibacteria group bacterium]|nr:hypothetical protein [Patescibacteria group bacterium]
MKLLTIFLLLSFTSFSLLTVAFNAIFLRETEKIKNEHNLYIPSYLERLGKINLTLTFLIFLTLLLLSIMNLL